MKTIPLDPKTLVSHVADMYECLNSDPDLPETYIVVNDGMPVIVLPELEPTAEEEMDILEEAL